mmetsp:Transcript_42312/g.135440  ORF Transcript_42312/g.135440 Transcript_42312/m.135440 type:complete len:1109 (-) Transcript_42312:20-3346(-)
MLSLGGLDPELVSSDLVDFLVEGEGAAPEEAEEAPNRREDYQGWLEHQKRKWKAQREGRKRQKKELQRAEERARFDEARGKSTLDPRGPSTTVGAFFRHANQAVTHTHWQILTLGAGRGAGEFTAWAMVQGTIWAIPLKVPRTVYINSRLAEAEGGVEIGRRVSRRLPHSKPVHNLYEAALDESDFTHGELDLSARLSLPHVEGVYETQVPLDLHAVLEVGCVVSVVPAARNRALGEGFSLDELRMRNTTECPYLEAAAGTSELRHVALYHSAAGGGGERAVLALLLPATSRLLVVIVNAFNNRDMSRGNIAAFVRRLRDSAADNATLGFPEGLEVELSYAKTEAEAGRKVQTALGAYREQARGPTMVVVQSPLGTERLAAQVPALRQYPLVPVPANAADSAYPPIQWQKTAAETALVRLMDVAEWVELRVGLSRYAHLPVSAFGHDWRMATMDAFFARKLRDAKHVLWMSRTGAPDLGSGEASEGALGEELSSPELVFPGSYRGVCIELKINHLAVNAIDKSGQINELEGGVLLGLDSEAGNQLLAPDSHDEQLGCAPAFKVLKSLVQSWLQDAVSNDSVFADHLLSHLYHWVSSPQSRLYDPALHRLVHMMMYKVFLLLVAELKKLGAAIVYADFNQVIIATGKRDLPSAKGYCDYLLATLRDRELFSWLVLEPKVFWRVFLFRDLHNFAGIQCAGEGAPEDAATGGAPTKKERRAAERERRRQEREEGRREVGPKAAAGGEEGGEAEAGAEGKGEGEGEERVGPDGEEAAVEDAEDDSDAESGGTGLSAEESDEEDDGVEEVGGAGSGEEIRNSWNLALYLPEVVQEHFYILVSELIYLPYDHMRTLEAQREEGVSQAPSAAAARAMEGEGEEVTFLREKINGHFTKKMLRWTREIQKHIGGGNDDPTHDFPSLAGSHLSPEELGSPALAFVRAVCHVFFLDPAVENDVRVMQRNALKLLHIREFSPEARFVEPCLSFVLRGVVCEYCNDCRDLDLCRDPALQEGKWECSVPECRHPYDLRQIESTLLLLVRRRVRAYQLQDLRDAKSKRVVSGQMSAIAKYTAGVVCSEGAEDARKSLRVFHNIAKYHEFELLKDTVEWLLSGV